MVKKKTASTKAVRQAEKSVADIRKRTAKLLKRAELDVREYRKELKTLQKQGIVSKRITPRTHKPTRYMLGKIKQFKGVAIGREIALPINKISPHRAREYIEKGMARQIGNFITRPRTSPKEKIDVFKDHIRTTTELNRGQEEVILFPARLEDMNDVLEWLSENEDKINELKGPRGQLGFQLSGHNSRTGLANVRELIKYLMRYDGTDPRLRGNIFNGHSKQIVTEFVLIRFRPAVGETVQPHMEPYYGKKRYSASHDKHAIRNEQHKRKAARERKARQRLAEDREQHAARIERQRNYDRANANARREKRMAKKLIDF